MFTQPKFEIRIFQDSDSVANLVGGSSPSQSKFDYSSLIKSLASLTILDGLSTAEVKQAELVSTQLQDLLAKREFNRASNIEPASIFPDYVDYHGTFNVSHDHIARIVPGYQKPSAALLEERKQIQQAVYGSMPASESSVAIEIVRALKPRTIFEIGTHRGYLMKALMEAAPDDTFGITIDLPSDKWDSASYPHDRTQYSYTKNCAPDEIGEAILASPEIIDRVAVLKGDSAKLPYLPFHHTMDVVVVDGNHNYEAAKEDLEIANSLVSPGGIILIDDVNKPFRLEGVTLAVLERTYHNREVFYFANHKDGPDGCLAFHVGE